MMEGSDIIAAEAIIDNGRFGKRVVRFETGRLAKQAAGSALAYLDDSTTVLSATTVGKNPKDQFDFFPLTVDVEERQYAAGRIPGSFFRREGRAGTEAILAARLIDRPLRPGFVKGLRNEVQVVETVLTIDPDDAYDVLAINAASMSTQIAGLPFTGPIGGTRLALIDGQWVAFPRWSELERSVFNIVVAGRIVTKEDGSEDVAIMMVEAGGGKNEWELIQAGATAPTEDVVADGLEAAKPFIKALCEAQIKVAEKASKETADFPLFLDYTDEEYAAVEEYAAEKVAQALLTEGKLARDEAVDAVKEEMLGALAERFPESEKALKAAFRSLEKATIRNRTLREEIRMDGRTPRQIRSLSAEVEVLPRVHGSALFQRGETQILGITTLAMLRMEQQIDNLSPVNSKRYMHQYNFAPVLHGRGRPRRLPEAPRDRPRRPGRARPGSRPALARGLPLRDPSGLRDHGLQRLLLDGLRVRLDPVPPPGRRAAARPRRGHRDGPHDRRGRRPVQGRHPDRHPGRRGRLRRHGLQGCRYP